LSITNQLLYLPTNVNYKRSELEKHFKNDLRDQYYDLRIKKLQYLLYDVCCNNLHVPM